MESLTKEQRDAQELALAYAPHLHAWIISGKCGSFIVTRKDGELPSITVTDDYHTRPTLFGVYSDQVNVKG